MALPFIPFGNPARQGAELAVDYWGEESNTNDYSLLYDPEFSFDGGRTPYYKPWIDGYNSILKDEINTTIDVGDETWYNIDRGEDSSETRNYNMIKDRVDGFLNEELSWLDDVPSKARDGLSAFWTSKIYSGHKAIYDKIPFSDLDNNAKQRIYDHGDNIIDAHEEMIRESAKLQLNEFRDSSLGFAQSWFNSADNYTSGAKTLLESPWLPFGEQEALRSWSSSLKAKAEQYDSPSGLYGMSQADIWGSDYDSKLEQFKDSFTALMGHGISSFPNQVPSFAQYAAAMHPAGRGAKWALGVASIGLGTLGETGGMANEMYNNYKELRSDAIGYRKASNLDEMSDEELIQFNKDFNKRFLLSNGKTADLLTDEEIVEYGDQAARAYGLASTVIETIEFATVGKWGKMANDMKQYAKNNQGHLAKIWFKKYFSDAGKGFVTQGGEEFAQEYISESIKEAVLPDHQKDWLGIVESGVIGGLYGTAMGGLQTVTSLRGMKGPERWDLGVKSKIDVYKQQNTGVPLSLNSGGIDVSDDGSIAVKGGYDNALIVGRYTNPTNFKELVSRHWGVPQEEVEARWEALLMDKGIDTSERGARFLIDKTANIDSIFPRLKDPNVKMPWDREKMEFEDPMEEEEVFWLDRVLQTDPDFDPFNELDPDVNEGLDEFGGFNDNEAIQWDLEQLGFQRAQILATTDPSVLSPQDRKQKLKDIDKQIEALKKQARMGPVKLNEARNTKVKKAEEKRKTKVSVAEKKLLEIQEDIVGDSKRS